MRSFEEWLEATGIEPTYLEKEPMRIAYEAGLRIAQESMSVSSSAGLEGLVQVSKEDLRKLIIQCDYACIFLREAKYGGKAEALKAEYVKFADIVDLKIKAA